MAIESMRYTSAGKTLYLIRGWQRACCAV